jgi:tetratricopeptide (TPR) repeat protein
MSSLLILAGCAGIGIVASSDPDVKLNDAENLYLRLDRPLPAEKLISEAIAIYQERGDFRRLGDAYREYGGLLLSRSLTKWGFSNMKFHDQSVTHVTYDSREANAFEYFRKALEVYRKYEPQPLEAKQYDQLTNLYYVSGWTYNALKEPANTCLYFNKSLAAYAENVRLNPASQQRGLDGFKSFPDLVANDEKILGLDCNSKAFKKN